MKTLKDGYSGLSLLANLCWERIIYASAITLSLAAAGMISPALT